MDLFDSKITKNILPLDGEVFYQGKILSLKLAQYFYETLLDSIEWKNDEAVIFGKHFITKRKAAWYGESGLSYAYSNITKEALPWTVELLELKKMIENISGETYNSCLLNLYHDGAEGMGWHSDDEKSLKKNGTIASISLGAERKFSFKHKTTKQTLSILLENGSLLLMQGTTQTHWLHSMPKTTKIAQPRINLTFRTIVLS